VILAALSDADPEPDPTTGDLVRRARRGEVAAMELLARRHLRAAYVVALAVLRRPADAEDVAQEAFVVALEKLDACDPDRFSGWLVRIVRTRALNAADKRRIREPGEAEPDASPAPAVPLGDRGLRERLVAALDGLTRVQREVVLLHDLESWTHAEIAEALGLTENNCRQHLFAARRALRARLGDAP